MANIAYDQVVPLPLRTLASAVVGSLEMDRAKDGYVNDNINSLLSVSCSLGLQFSLNCALSSKWGNVCLINEMPSPMSGVFLLILS